MTVENDIAYGIHAVASLVENRSKRLQEVLINRDRRDKRVQRVIDLCKDGQIKIKFLERQAFDRLIKKYQLEEVPHQGILAQTTPMETLSEHDLWPLLEQTSEPIFLILDGVTDPHNIGACLRTADATGVTALIVPKDKSATLTAAAIKIASGAAETIPFIQVTNLARTMRSLQDKGVWIVGTAGEADHSLHQARFKGPLALVMGAEGSGMRRLTRETCDELINIPMLGQVSSLNVSVATGVCLYEIVRQRLAN
ncbi:23S rRNA (guanosine(2251)-2'-O)-methyltransferase RlmB [Gynuella sunshinyii]|uniref:23S rRNA (guanosine-2'-O-)-methyltransferase RlmB n=1 Tax=Gynuella sunshinyii YC6258 TaxID=1445510 RepID=A0A0C5VI82_9GAMM|nr:23S rRNA (guanosine(2251)-2'-O)-methyltransferase RlmB [Gynuella sunshinyii]AJQ94372.1 rRNA methylase [Gynuella sunshinyii YC6258]